MNSKERLLAAIKQQDVDYLPCSVYFNSNLKVNGYDLTNPEDRIKLQKDLGGDPVTDFYLPDNIHPEVKTHTWIEKVDGKDILFKEYQTPAGTVRQGIKYTSDWPHGEDIPLNDDHAASNIFEPLLKGPDDVDAFSYVYSKPDPDILHEVSSLNNIAKELADKYEIPVRGLGGMGLSVFMFAMGAQNAVMFAVDYPDAFKRAAEIITDVSIERIKLLKEMGVDFIKRFGGYEQTNFYSPQIFRDAVVPQLRKEVEAAHVCDLPIYYRVVTGMEPILTDITSVGFDCIEGGEPHLSNCSLEQWHETVSGKASSWTGISTPAVLGGDDSEIVRKEVRRCIEIFGKKGYILGVTNSIRNHFPWENTLAMFDEWKKNQ